MMSHRLFFLSILILFKIKMHHAGRVGEDNVLTSGANILLSGAETVTGDGDGDDDAAPSRNPESSSISRLQRGQLRCNRSHSSTQSL